MRMAREGIRWHRIEPRPSRYDFSFELPRIRAARSAGIQVIWDLCHFGWPDHVDVFRPEFINRLAGMAGAFADVLVGELQAPRWYAPINEISFMAWGAGDVGYINPFAERRGNELKRQMVRASIAAIDAIRDVDAGARFLQPEPMIHIRERDVRDRAAVHGYNESQYEATDMLTGRIRPELGGDPRYLDVLGVNYYPRNQWIHHGRTLPVDDPARRSFAEMLAQSHARYGRPLLIAETGTEDADRAPWLRHVCNGVRDALEAGVPVHGICLYPVLNHPGWDDDRHCHNGLWDYADGAGERPVHEPLLEEIVAQRAVLSDVLDAFDFDQTALESSFTPLEPRLPRP